MDLTNNDRRIIIIALFLLALVSLIGFVLLGGLVLYRLNDGEDIQPGQVALLLGLLTLATNSCSLLAPSPLSKTSGAQDVNVVNDGPEDAIPVKESKK